MTTKKADALVFTELLISVNDQLQSRENVENEAEALALLQKLAQDLLANDCPDRIPHSTAQELVSLTNGLTQLDYRSCQARLKQLVDELRTE